MSGDQPGAAFTQANRYRKGRGGYQPLWIVWHDAECSESATAAEALQGLAAANPAEASWHYAVDCDSVTQSVREADCAWHAGLVNDCSIGIEIAGRASQDAAGWRDAFSTATLLRVAELTRDVCARWQIPARAIDDATLVGGLASARALKTRGADADEWLGLRTLVGGIITHAQVTRAFGIRGGHTDPGPAFPLEATIQIAARQKTLVL